MTTIIEIDEDNFTNKINFEPLLHTEQRLALHPIEHVDIWELYKKQLKSFWTREELDLSHDYNDYIKLDKNTQYFIKNILAFFATSDGLVFLNIIEQFSKEVKILEAQICYQFQATMEGIHSEVYSEMINEIIKDEEEKILLFDAINTLPCIKAKGIWATKWINNDTLFSKRLIAYAIIEGIFFSGSFCAIYWLKQQNIFPGLTMANEFIARDEGMHCEFACLLYSKIVNRIPQETIHDMIREAVIIEKEFIINSLPCKLIGINSDLMSTYIEFIADNLVNDLGYKKIYGSKNPFGFIENINIEIKNNFFENRTTNYQKIDITKNNLVMTDDF